MDPGLLLTDPPGKKRSFRGVKTFFLGFVIGVVSSVAIVMCSGCGSGKVVSDAATPDSIAPDMFVFDAKPPQPDLLPTNIDPVQACYDVAQQLGDKEFECTNDQSKAYKFKTTLEDAWNCPGITALRDGVEFYTVCLPAIKALSCADFQGGSVPDSCKSQLLE
jgi:hypothetical protein